MATHIYRQEPSAPPMYPQDIGNIRPVPPVRSEFNRHAQEETLLPPAPPPRGDIPPRLSPTDVGLRRDDNEENIGDKDIDCSCNYNLYATKKTIGLGFMAVALIMSNALQLRTLILQKQHDHIWIASLVLVCISILSQIGLAFILYIIAKGDIRNPQKQTRLERFNTVSLIIIILISIINVIINIFMLTTNPRSFLDARTLELLQQMQK